MEIKLHVLQRFTFPLMLLKIFLAVDAKVKVKQQQTQTKP